MLHTTGTQIATNDGRDVLWVVHLVLNVLAACGIVGSGVVSCTARKGSCSNGIGTVLNENGIPDTS